MNGKQPDLHSTDNLCPAGDDKCTNLPEVKRLQQQIKQLAALVQTDELTRLFNFRYFNQALNLEMERTRRSGLPACLLLLDLDHFKSINDAYGHEAGNIVLGHVSSLIRNTVRRLDVPCRYGGEEFAIILPDTTLRQGVGFANRLRVIIENSPAKASDALLELEASFGVDVYQQGDQLTEKEFVKKVDSFLYLAKQKGRNRVCHGSFGDSSDNKEDKASAANSGKSKILNPAD